VTPRLLSASGIVHDNLGQGLQDHPSVMFPIAVKSETMARSAATAIARISSGVPGSRENDGQVIAYEYIDPTRQWAGVSVILIDVYSRGQIDVSDPKSVPDIGSLQDVRDITAMRSLVRKTVTMLSTGEFGEVFCDADGTDATHLLTLDDKSLDAWVRKHCVPLSHVSGTCAMGDNNPVDECGRVRGVSGLWVADSSVMPRIVRGNTNLPTTMIASRISEFLGEQLQPNQP
jgi:choline dehydrogenase-like flavoprotein